jgi:outer membrane receptor protein involved in Fe transport
MHPPFFQPSFHFGRRAIGIACPRRQPHAPADVRPIRVAAFLLLTGTACAQVESLEPVTVSATRAPEPLSDVPLLVEVVPGDAFDDGFSLSADDALRGSADFSLFRRNDSLTANPTSQGVSLRGLGPSGASRSLVLLDGIPLNDPFGGWVPWSLVPVDSLASAEIVPGGGAAAWGNDALAGVIQLFSVRPLPGTGAAAAEWGGFNTRSADLEVAEALGPGTLELLGQEFATAGTVLVAPGNRGPVDIAAASRHDSAAARWRGSVGRGVEVEATLRTFDEWRDNGTPYQQNQSRQVLGSVAVTGRAGPGESWNATAYLQNQGFSQTFSSVNAARSAETPASDQFAVPTTAAGLEASSTWDEGAGAQTTAGADFRNLRGETREDYAYSGGAYADLRHAGGAQTFAGIFVEQVQPLGPSVTATAGLRVDAWGNDDGHETESALATGAVLLNDRFPDRSGTELSPSAGLAWKATDALDLHVALQRAFREPTLNELYRPFRVGSTITDANPNLATEHADSAEAGAAWGGSQARVTLDAFAARLEDAVDNVTLAEGPGTFPLFGKLPAGGIGQERLNLDRVDTEGLQLGASWKPSQAVSLDLSVIDEEAIVAAASVAPGLVGRTLPEVPRWSGSLGLAWHPEKRVLLTARVRTTGSQFDDDQNLLPLAAATVADASLRVLVSRNAEVFVYGDNLGDARVETAHSATGVFSVAPGRAVGVGARLHW